MKIIGISGRKFSGKDTVSNIFVKREGFKKVAFADPLKELIQRVFHIEHKYLHDDKLKEADLPEYVTIDYSHLDEIRSIVENEWGFVISRDQREGMERFFGEEFRTARTLMQAVGTDMLRNYVRDDIFIVLFFSRIKELSCDIVVSDVRLKNERDALKNAGASLMLIKRDIDNKDQHISENDLGKESEYQVVIHNSDITLQELESEVLLWYSIKAKYK